MLIGFDNSDAVRLIEDPMRNKFLLQVSIIKSPMPLLRVRRGQLSADDVLSEVCRLRQMHRNDYALGLTDQDLYVPDRNFVFGLASRDGACAAVSTNRLKGDGPGPYAERLAKEVMHELGHLFGLGHCSNPECVMHFSDSLGDTDRKSDRFCPKCSTALRV